MDQRLAVSQQIREAVIEEFVQQLRRRLEKHGDKSFIGPHEALGTIAEEYDEFLEAVRSNDHLRVSAEAYDLMVGAFWTVASLLAIRDVLRVSQ